MSDEKYISFVEGKSVSGALYDRIGLVTKILEKVKEEQKWNYRYAKDKWTVKQLVQHLIDCERIFSFRAMHIVRKDASPLFLFDENDYAKEADVSLKTQQDLIEEYSFLMKATYLMYKNFNERELKQSAVVEGNTMDVETIGKKITGHSLHHMEILRERYLDKK